MCLMCHKVNDERHPPFLGLLVEKHAWQKLENAEPPHCHGFNPSGAIAVLVVVGGANEITSECPLN